MSQNLAPPYIPGQTPPQNQPMGRFLPPIHQGVASNWLENYIPRDTWILDPFGASTNLVMEIARNGYQVLVAANNPVIAFLIEMMASAPQEADLIAALATLGSAKFRDTRIEPHIRSLYQSDCRNCSAPIQAEAFLWEKDASTPYGLIYTCPHCQDSDEYPTNENDKARAAQFAESNLHRSRALERVASIDDPDRVYAKEALDVYPNRAVYILSTLLNKLEGLPLTDEMRSHLGAMLLVSFDQANTLWPHPTARERPRQLTIPPSYRENNIWLALENSIALWHSGEPRIPLTFWPDLPDPGGGICLYEGRIKGFAQQLTEIPIGAIVTAFPRPNQAFWTLSALWAGWLWDPEITDRFKSVLRRQRYSWRWHTVALTAALRRTRKALASKIPLLGLITEAEAGFLTAVMTASHLARFNFRGIALREDEGQAQLSLSTKKKKRAKQAQSELEMVKNGARAYLENRAEPSGYLPVLAASLSAINQNPAPKVPPDEKFYQTQKIIDQALSFRGGFLRLDVTSQAPDSGYWWLSNYQADGTPLSDQVEMEVVNYLLKYPGCTFAEVDEAVCVAFPGQLTPSRELICMCLISYGEQIPPDSDSWKISHSDNPSNRKDDLSNMEELITQLGNNLGLATHRTSSDPVVFEWGIDSETIYTLYLTVSAVLGKIFNHEKQPKGQPLIVLPGGRANLVTYKLNNNPLFEQMIEEGWQFLKFRHVRQLINNPSLNLDNLSKNLALDPLAYAEPQIRLL